MKTIVKKFNRNIFSSLLLIGLLVFIGGCQQVNDLTGGNKATNGNTATNANANSNANNNSPANSNANTSASPANSASNTNSEASNTATSTKEEAPLTAEEQEFKNTLVGEWKNEQMTITFTDTEFSSKLNDGTINSGPYKIVDETTIEAVLTRNNARFKATMSFENDGKTLNWSDPSGKYKYTRVK